MQQEKRPRDVAIRPLVTFKKTVIYEKVEMEDRLQNRKNSVFEEDSPLEKRPKEDLWSACHWRR